MHVVCRLLFMSCCLLFGMYCFLLVGCPLFVVVCGMWCVVFLWLALVVCS